MKAILILLLTASSLLAGDAAALKALGITVTESAGVVTQATAKCATFGESEFKLLGQCTTLKKLSLDGKTVTDQTLPLLSGLVNLEELSINGMQLTDTGYEHFKAFKKLRSLSLFHPAFGSKEFTGSGLVALKELPVLERLTFAGSTAGDAAMEAIGQITQLKEFRTWHTAQTQAGNAHLLKLTKLTALRVGQRLPKWGSSEPPSFDESTMQILAQLQTLEKLELTEARLSAGIIPALKALPNLKSLKLETVDISESDVTKLREALADCKVEHKPMSDAEKESLLVKKLKL